MKFEIDFSNWYIKKRRENEMKILVSYGYYADVIDCPTHIADKIKELQREFDVWLNDPKNEHNLWFHDEIQGNCLSFDAQDFADWINEHYLNDSEEKVVRISSQILPTKEQKKLSTIYI